MNNRRRMTGVVTSNQMTKTVVVEITRKFRHPLYKKVVFSSMRVKAHDEIGCQMGDEVQIVETRPLSDLLIASQTPPGFEPRCCAVNLLYSWS